MQEPVLEVTFRHGRPLAAYYYLPRAANAEVARSRRVGSGLVVDDSSGGEAIGVEITAPSKVTLEGFNAVLAELGACAVGEEEFAPLHAA